MVKKFAIILLVLMPWGRMFGQLEPLQSAYTYNMMYINPANTGISGMGALFFWHRAQWVGFADAPSTTMFSFEFPYENMAFGANVFYDTEGVTSRFNGTVAFSYVLEVGENTSLAFGINVGADQYVYDPSKLNVKDPGEAYFENPYTFLRIVSGVGATFYSDSWFLGISSPNVVPQKTVGSSELTSVYHRPRIYLTGGLNMPVSYGLTILPSFLWRYAGDQPLNFDATLLFSIHDRVTTGFTYRFDAAYILLAGFKVTKRFMVGYSFDLDATPLRKYTKGSHEFFMKYEFPTPKGKVRFQSPRFF